MSSNLLKSFLNSRNKEVNNKKTTNGNDVAKNDTSWHDKYKEQVLKQTLNNEQAKLRQYYAEKYDSTEVEKNTILYEVRDGTSFTDSPRSLFNYLVSTEKYKNYKHIIVFDKKHQSNFPTEELSRIENVMLVQIDTFKYMDWLLKANFLITNSTFRSSFLKKENQIYINTWHGTPLKHMGDAYTYDPINASNVRRNFLMTDYLFSPNTHTTRIFLEDYKLNGIWKGKILENGLPRNDLNQYNSKNNIVKKLLFEDIDIDLHKKTIVYMPTWTGTDVNLAKDITMQLVSLVEKINLNIGNRINFLVKVHPFLYDLVKENNEIKKYLIPNKYDSNEIFKVADCLVTNYSSVFFDFLVTDKPIIFYNWDSEYYDQTRGNYFSENELPGPISKNVSELINTLKNIDEIHSLYKSRYDLYKERFVINEDANMIEEYVETIFNNEKNKLKVVEPDNKKIKLLIHPGALYDNGITSSFLNLVNQIDYSKYDVTAFLHESKDKEVLSNFRKINQNVRKMFKPGLPIYTLEENIRDRYLKNDIPNEVVNDNIFPEQGYIRESKRLFANTDFDAVIDFSGYSYFWAKYLVVNSAPVKVAYMHNDLWAETNREVDGKFPLRNDLFGIFSLYSKFTSLVSVSEALKEINQKKLNRFVKSDQMTFVENTIDLPKIFSNNQTDDMVLPTIIEENKEILFEKGNDSLNVFKELSDISSNKFYYSIVDFSSHYVSAYRVTFGNDNYQYIIENNIPLGWVKIFNMKDSLYKRVSMTKVEIEAFTNKSLNYIYKTIDDIILGNGFNFNLEKYSKLKILSSFIIENEEYFYAKMDNFGEKSILINADDVNILNVRKVQKKESFKYLPNIFQNFLPYVKVNSNNNVKVFLGNDFKKSVMWELPNNIYFNVDEIKIKDSGVYYLISESNRTIGWVSQKDSVNICEYLPLEIKDIKNKTNLNTFIKSSQNVLLVSQENHDNTNIVLNDSREISVLGEQVVEGELYFNVIYKLKPYIVKCSSVQSETLVFKNAYIEFNKTLKKAFIISRYKNNGQTYYNVLIDNSVVCYSDNSSITFVEKTPLILNRSQEELFVTLKAGDIVWHNPYDNTIENRRVASTGMLKNYVFKTSSKVMNYKHSIFTDLFYNGKVIGWVNIKNIKIASYQEYIDSKTKSYPTEMLLTYHDKKIINNNIFNNEYSLYSSPNELMTDAKKMYINKEKKHYVDGQLVIENRKIWKRIVEENKIIGYLEWEKNFDNLLSEKSEVKTKKADSTKTVYHISSKKIKAQIIFPVSNDIKTYDSAESILKNNFEVSDFSEEYYLADEVISFNPDYSSRQIKTR